MPIEEDLESDLWQNDEKEERPPFNFEEFVNKNRVPLTIFLLGAVLAGLGVFLFKKGYIGSLSKIEVLETATDDQEEKHVVVEIAGAVERPGVYTLSSRDRVNDLLVACGGLSSDADRQWVEKTVNKAAKLSDGQKLYIPSVDERSSEESANFWGGREGVLGTSEDRQTKPVNINTASQSELENLWGIGPVYAQNIIEHRPYSSIEELLEKKILKENVYEKNKELLVVY